MHKDMYAQGCATSGQLLPVQLHPFLTTALSSHRAIYSQFKLPSTRTKNHIGLNGVAGCPLPDQPGVSKDVSNSGDDDKNRGWVD